MHDAIKGNPRPPPPRMKQFVVLLLLLGPLLLLLLIYASNEQVAVVVTIPTDTTTTSTPTDTPLVSFEYTFTSPDTGLVIRQILPPLIHRPPRRPSQTEGIVESTQRDLAAVNNSVFSCEAYDAAGLAFTSHALALATRGDWEGFHNALAARLDPYGRPYLMPPSDPFAKHVSRRVAQLPELATAHRFNISGARLYKLLQLEGALDLCPDIAKRPDCLFVATLVGRDETSVDWAQGDHQASRIATEVLTSRLHEARWSQVGLRHVLCRAERYLYRVGGTDIFLGVVKTISFGGDDERGGVVPGQYNRTMVWPSRIPPIERAMLVDVFAYLDFVLFGAVNEVQSSLTRSDAVPLWEHHCIFFTQTQQSDWRIERTPRMACDGLRQQTVQKRIVRLKETFATSAVFASAFEKVLRLNRRRK